MTAKKFQEDFRALMHRAKSEQPCPLAQIILELETEKTRCVNIFIELEARKAAEEMIHKIIPANGKLPEIILKN